MLRHHQAKLQGRVAVVAVVAVVAEVAVVVVAHQHRHRQLVREA